MNNQIYSALRHAAERIGMSEYRAGHYKVKRDRRGRVIQGYSLSEPHQRVQETLDAYARGRIGDEEAMAVLHEYDVFNARTRSNPGRSAGMSRSAALTIDRDFYAEYDENSGFYCVFGDASGFCYSTHTDKDEAEDKACEMELACMRRRAGMDDYDGATYVRRNARYGGDPHWMVARFSSECSRCKSAIRKGEQIFYYPNGKRVLCSRETCGGQASREFEAAKFDEGGW